MHNVKFPNPTKYLWGWPELLRKDKQKPMAKEILGIINILDFLASCILDNVSR
jgi:hypothetical protein